DDGNACTVGDHCSGTGDACIFAAPRDCSGVCLTGACDPIAGCGHRPTDQVCRPAAGPCDLPERCDGAAPGCPPDAFAPASVVCRTAAGACDAEELCDGVAARCPPDAKRSD